jgi:hypothetical protein
MAMADSTHWGRGFDAGGGLPPAREAFSESDQAAEEQPVRSGVALDRARTVRSRQPGSGGSAGEGGGPEQPLVIRCIRRISLWCYERIHGDIRDAREATATNPLIVAAVGPNEARAIAYRSYANVIEDSIVGNGGESQ